MIKLHKFKGYILLKTDRASCSDKISADGIIRSIKLFHENKIIFHEIYGFDMPDRVPSTGHYRESSISARVTVRSPAGREQQHALRYTEMLLLRDFAG